MSERTDPPVKEEQWFGFARTHSQEFYGGWALIIIGLLGPILAIIFGKGVLFGYTDGVLFVGSPIRGGSYSLPLVVFGIAALTFGIRNPQDFYGGVVLAAVALFALWAANDLPGMRGFSFGPGTGPRLFAGLLILLGTVVALVGLLADGAPLERYRFRGPMLITASILVFAVSIRPLGLVISSFLTFVIAGLASTETRWIESLIAAVALTAFCVFLFSYVLNLPFQLWPRF